MSKIQINELNANSIESLNAQETTEVVGGLADFFNGKFANLNQQNFNFTQQAAIAIGGSASNSNTTTQTNNGSVTQVL